MKLENVKVGMKVFVKAKQCGVGHTESDSLNREGTVIEIDDSDRVYTLKVGFGDNLFDYDWMNHKQVKSINKPTKLKPFNPKIGGSVYVTSKALDSGCPERTVESVVTWTGSGYKCTDGYSWLRLDLGSYRKPKEGDRINSARLTLGTIKVGMKVRTLEGTLTDKFRFPIGTEFTVTSIHSDGKYATIYYKKPDGTLYKQTDSIEHLTKSW